MTGVACGSAADLGVGAAILRGASFTAGFGFSSVTGVETAEAGDCNCALGVTNPCFFGASGFLERLAVLAPIAGGVGFCRTTVGAAASATVGLPVATGAGGVAVFTASFFFGNASFFLASCVTGTTATAGVAPSRMYSTFTASPSKRSSP